MSYPAAAVLEYPLGVAFADFFPELKGCGVKLVRNFEKLF